MKKSDYSSYSVKLSEAVSYLQSGHTKDARAKLNILLSKYPKNDQILYFISLSYYMEGNLKNATENMDKALKLNRDISYIKDACDMYFDLGLEYFEKNDYKNAKTCFEKNFNYNKKDCEAIEKLLICNIKLNIWNEALDLFNMLESRNYFNASSYYNIALAYSHAERYEEALKLFMKADSLLPEDALTLYNIGSIYLQQEKFTEAIEYLEKSIKIKPEFPECILNLGLVYNDLRDYERAIEYYKKTIEIKPDYLIAYINAGTAYLRSFRMEEAFKYLSKAEEIAGDDINLLNNIGYYWQNMNETDKALEYYKRVLTIEPDNADAHFNISTIYLSNGKYNEGWEQYEWRFKRTTGDTPSIPELRKPLWKGESLEGKTLYVYPEQGFGDALQFSRYLPMLAKSANKVIYKAVGGVKPLFDSSKLNTQIVSYEVPDTELNYDYYIPLLSIPHVLKTTVDDIPLSEGYLTPSPEKIDEFKNKYFNNDRYKVGIFWHGNLKINPTRHMSLNDFLPLLDIEGIKVYSFQRGLGIEQLDRSTKKENIVNMGCTFKDFADTASAMKNLDLMITIDTSIAHLAGAIAHPSYLLLPKWAEWRWMQDIEYSPWYDSLTLFRQKNYGDWQDVIQRVCEKIEHNIKLTK